MGYPSAEPSWQVTDLEQLSSAGDLSGINPLVLAGIAGGESGYENAGPGINTAGYGGYFGLGENSSYSYGPNSFTDTPAELETNSSPSFELQAETAAAEVAHLLSSNTDGGGIQGALAGYTGGGPDNIDYELASENLGGGSATSGGSGGMANIGALGASAASLGASVGETASISTTLTGFGAFLQSLDILLNPSPAGALTFIESLGTADIAKVIEMIAVRGLLTVGFLGMTWLGFKTLTGRSAGSSIVNLYDNVSGGSSNQPSASNPNTPTPRESSQPAIRSAQSVKDSSFTLPSASAATAAAGESVGDAAAAASSSIGDIIGEAALLA